MAAAEMTVYEVRDLAIMRDPQPNDVLVVKLPDETTAETIHEFAEALDGLLPCRVVVITESVDIVEFERGAS
jgi:methyl coenzyme M reductase alpha subunit